MYRRQILYTILKVVLFSVVLIGARRSGEPKFQLNDNSAGVRFRTSLNTTQKRNADQLDALLFQVDLSLLDVFEPNSSSISGRMMKEEEQGQDKTVLIIDSQDLSPLDLEPGARMMMRLDGHEIQGSGSSDETIEATFSAIESEYSCEIIIVQEEEYFQQQEMETFIQEEFSSNEETGEVSIEITVVQQTTCQTVFQCKPQVHPILGTRCFCRNVLICQTIYG